MRRVGSNCDTPAEAGSKEGVFVQEQISLDRYDVIIAGARCAGASTAMLLARQGLRVLVVDPAKRGTDTLSTHALMRGGVLQLHRWGVLDAIRSAGTPAIRTTTFHYGDEVISIPIKERDGVDALYAPRRTVLDGALAAAAAAAGAEVVHGRSLVDLIMGDDGRVRGARIAGSDQQSSDVAADLVIGADGIRSRVARLLELGFEHTVPHTTASIYGYWKDLGLDGNHWYYELGAAVGSIPTNDDETCVFASVAQERFEAERGDGLEALYTAILDEVSGDLARRVIESEGPGKLRAFAGTPGFVRKAAGPGWALVGDAGYFRDPLTAHGITDALRDAEFLTRAVLEGGEDALRRYDKERYERVRGFFEITDRIASFDWDMDQVKEDHLVLAREMNGLVETQLAFDAVGQPD
jgi:2-polyprenyl-6-methoxyphenol hydroxylase-like FAD-dependent oxidoreductase